MREIIKIVIADDHIIFRTGLKLILNGIADYKVIAEASNGKELLHILSKESTDVVFIDIRMPVMDGIEATTIIRQKYPDIKIIALSMFGEIEFFNKIFDTGAHGFLLKNAQPDELKQAISCVLAGETYFAKEFVNHAVVASASSAKKRLDISLTDRELEILELICKGLSTPEISEKLHLSNYTVEGHRKNLLSKTNTKNTAALVSFAFKNGYVEP